MSKVQEDVDRYLIFRLGTEIYGTPLLGVREVVEYQEPKRIPNTVDHCLGVINIRGEIIGVVDLRARFGHPNGVAQSTSLLVFSTAEGGVSAVVDQVESVVGIRSEEIEPSPNIQLRVPSEFLIGIGRHRNQLVTLIDLNRVLKREEVENLHRSKLAA